MAGNTTELFQKASDLVIKAFNAQGIPYGTRAKHSYPVKHEDIFTAPPRGGSSHAVDECRALIAFVLANHIPVYDLLRDDLRLAPDICIANFLKRTRRGCNKIIGLGCHLVKREGYRAAYHRSLAMIEKEGIELWNVNAPKRTGNCEER